jgi:hypothetical protein
LPRPLHCTTSKPCWQQNAYACTRSIQRPKKGNGWDAGMTDNVVCLLLGACTAMITQWQCLCLLGPRAAMQVTQQQVQHSAAQLPPPHANTVMCGCRLQIHTNTSAEPVTGKACHTSAVQQCLHRGQHETPDSRAYGSTNHSNLRLSEQDQCSLPDWLNR